MNNVCASEIITVVREIDDFTVTAVIDKEVVSNSYALSMAVPNSACPEIFTRTSFEPQLSFLSFVEDQNHFKVLAPGLDDIGAHEITFTILFHSPIHPDRDH